MTKTPLTSEMCRGINFRVSLSGSLTADIIRVNLDHKVSFVGLGLAKAKGYGLQGKMV